MAKKYASNETCWCGSGKNYGTCHELIERRVQELKKEGHIVPHRGLIKTKAQLEGIRESGKRNIAILDEVVSKVQIGMSTAEIDRIVYEKTRALGGIPAPLGYEGFPKSVCTSINDAVCHGIPSEKDILKDGDIINIDCTTIYNGFFADSSRMVCVGQVSEEKQHLVEVAKSCIQVGLDEVKPWQFLGDMGHAIYQYVHDKGYSVVREVGGHGVGLAMHEEPFVSYVSKPKTGMVMVPGFVFTIEPMINMGSSRIKVDRNNGWTIYTKDGKPSAQWEVTVAVTETGYEILSY